MAKRKVQKDKQRSTKHTHKTKDRETRTPLKIDSLYFFHKERYMHIILFIHKHDCFDLIWSEVVVVVIVG